MAGARGAARLLKGAILAGGWIRFNRNRWRESGRELLNHAHVILPFSSSALLITVLGVGWYTQPDRLVRGYGPRQPIPYSHALHAGVLRIPCMFCHSGALKSRYAGVPSVAKCLHCHVVTRTDSPPIRQVSARYAAGEPIRWQRIHALPDHVYFDHRPHVSAGLLCQICHGEVQTMDVVRQQMSLRMGNCLGCHRNPQDALPADSTVVKGPDHCFACHR